MLLRNQQERMYQQLCNQLRADIKSRRLKCGEKLTSERQMARQYGVSARRAIQCLEELGLVRITPQKGTYVL